MYDVIIVGASFAGLAVARQLIGYRVLLLDRAPIGANQTSACGTALPVLHYWGLQDTVLQIHDRLILHTKRKVFEYLTSFLWCTFDYEQLCSQLFHMAGADFIQAEVKGYRDGYVETNQGRFSARCIVDASGWRAILASSLSPDFSGSKMMNFGIETIRPTSALHDSEGLHFWYDADFFKGGVGWVFPRGRETSYGIGSYRGAKPLKHLLKQFTGRFNTDPNTVHGTYFPSSLRKATVGPIFLVGDAAGMCLGLTGEGIRPAMFFGESCAQILRRVLETEISLQDGLAQYSAFVEKRRLFFDIFSASQKLLTRLPQTWIDWIASVIQDDHVFPLVLNRYWKLTQNWTEPNEIFSSQDYRAELFSIQEEESIHK